MIGMVSTPIIVAESIVATRGEALALDEGQTSHGEQQRDRVKANRMQRGERQATNQIRVGRLLDRAARRAGRISLVRRRRQWGAVVWWRQTIARVVARAARTTTYPGRTSSLIEGRMGLVVVRSEAKSQ